MCCFFSFSETKERRPLKTNVTVENMDNLERIVWDALNCDDIEKLREVIEKGMYFKTV
jgi:hypothetical protein